MKCQRLIRLAALRKTGKAQGHCRHRESEPRNLRRKHLPRAEARVVVVKGDDDLLSLHGSAKIRRVNDIKPRGIHHSKRDALLRERFARANGLGKHHWSIREQNSVATRKKWNADSFFE